MKRYKVLYCDLDGTLIETINEDMFPKGIWDMKFKFNVLDAIKNLAPEYVFIVSNQGGIEKGYVNSTSIIFKFKNICRCIKDYCNITGLVDYTYCSVNNRKSIMRKPNVGMLKSFFLDLPQIKKEEMLMIGDASGKEGQWSDTDKKTAENFGIDYMDVNDFVNECGK